MTHAAAADEDDTEPLQDPSASHDPRQTQEQDHPEDVLQAGQIDAHEGPHLRRLRRNTCGHRVYYIRHYYFTGVTSSV